MANKDDTEDNNKQFYGVSLPSDVNPEEVKNVKLVFDEKKEALEVLKTFKGSRFKLFDNINDAIIFSQLKTITKDVDFSHRNQSNQNIEKILSPFSGLHPREMSKLKKAIESGNYSTVEQLIQTNPRYLVGSGDTPSILMEGPRYNACHIAAKANKHEILRLILNTVSDKQFWKRLFPFDAKEITESRINFSSDLYLNTPCSEKASCDTPLHLSCKWGSLQTIAVLLSYSKCDIEKTNKFGKKPSEVICERKGDKNDKIEILKLFETQLYIPLIRNNFCPQIGKPVKGMVESEVLNGEVTAVAGPMSPKQAEKLYETLRSPHKCTPSDRIIRLTDSRKGLERVGRNLCKDMSINWEEFWSFLNTRIDLTSDEGLNRLETHLRHIYFDLDRNSSKEENLFSSQICETNEDQFSALLSPMSKLSLNSSDLSLVRSDTQNESFKEYIDCEQTSNMVLNLDESSNDSFTSAYSFPTFLYDFYINGYALNESDFQSELKRFGIKNNLNHFVVYLICLQLFNSPNISQEDIDAALALQHIIESERCLEYDFIQNWFKRVREENGQYFDDFVTSDLSLTLTPN